MKKNGFTLAELLIALSIVGVVAVLTAPTIGNIMPDKNKMLALKYHKILSEICYDLAHDRGLYMPDNGCKGLDCTTTPLDPAYKNQAYTGNNKFANLLSERLELDGNINGGTFTTTDGMTFDVTFDGQYHNIEIKGEKTDTFTFIVDPQGFVTPGLYTQRNYLEDPTNLKRQGKRGFNKPPVPPPPPPNDEPPPEEEDQD